MYEAQLTQDRLANIKTKEIGIAVNVNIYIDVRFPVDELDSLLRSIEADSRVKDEVFIENAVSWVISQLNMPDAEDKHLHKILNIVNLEKVIIDASVVIDDSEGVSSPSTEVMGLEGHRLSLPATLILKLDDSCSKHVHEAIYNQLLDMWGDRFITDPTHERIEDILVNGQRGPEHRHLCFYDYKQIVKAACVVVLGREE